MLTPGFWALLSLFRKSRHQTTVKIEFTFKQMLQSMGLVEYVTMYLLMAEYMHLYNE